MKTRIPKLFATLLAASAMLVSAQAQVTYKPQDIELNKGVDLEEVKDKINAAAADVMQKFVKSRNGESYQTFAVLPLKQDIDNGYGSLRLQDAFASVGRDAQYDVYTFESQKMKDAMKAIEFGQNFGDVMDPKTIQKFGKVVGADVVVFCRLDITTNNKGVTTVRLNLDPYVVETMQRLAGGESKQTIEPVALPEPVKSLLERAYPWILAGGGLLIVLVILKVIFRVVGNAARPR